MRDYLLVPSKIGQVKKSYRPVKKYSKKKKESDITLNLAHLYQLIQIPQKLF